LDNVKPGAEKVFPTRSGSIFVLSSSSESTTGNNSLEIVHQVPTNGGVFRFEAISSHIILAALTTGKVVLVDLTPVVEIKEPIKAEQQHTSDAVSPGMLLNATWSHVGQNILCSDNCGQLTVLDSAGTNFRINSQWMAHKFGYTQVCKCLQYYDYGQ
jgi:hypothetical protein